MTAFIDGRMQWRNGNGAVPFCQPRSASACRERATPTWVGSRRTGRRDMFKVESTVNSQIFADQASSSMFKKVHGI